MTYCLPKRNDDYLYQNYENTIVDKNCVMQGTVLIVACLSHYINVNLHDEI